MKKTIYIILSTIFGLLLSLLIHAGIEMYFLNWTDKNNYQIIWTRGVCALPLWLIILLTGAGIAFGIWFGFVAWNKIYAKK